MKPTEPQQPILHSNINLYAYEIEDGARWRWTAQIAHLGQTAHHEGFAANQRDAIRLGDAWVNYALGLMADRHDRQNTITERNTRRAAA